MHALRQSWFLSLMLKLSSCLRDREATETRTNFAWFSEVQNRCEFVTQLKHWTKMCHSKGATFGKKGAVLDEKATKEK